MLKLKLQYFGHLMQRVDSLQKTQTLGGIEGRRRRGRWRMRWLDGVEEIISIARTIINKDSVQFSSVAQSCLTLCDPMNHSTPGLLVHHQLLEFAQTRVHQVGDATQPSHPLSSPFPPAPNPSQHQSLFQ